MQLLAERWDSVLRFKRHGKDGAPVTGKLYEIAAKYLLECPESNAWHVDGEQIGQAKISNYIKNALATGKKYARQELYTVYVRDRV